MYPELSFSLNSNENKRKGFIEYYLPRVVTLADVMKVNLMKEYKNGNSVLR